MSQRTNEFSTKNSGDSNNQWNEITGQTDLKVFILNLLIVYKITFSVRLSWLIDWLIYKTY
jgi:hypothetical protein